jgi:hypothetical protein
MDISNRKSLLISINKKAENSLPREGAKEIARQIREPFRQLTIDQRREKLEALRDAMSSPGGMTYSPSQLKTLASFQDLFSNWETFGEYVNRPMQELGDWVAEKTVVPMVQKYQEFTSGAKDEGVNVPSSPDRAGAASKLKSESSNIDGLRHFKQTYSALQNNEFHKIASSDMVTEDISSAFEKELNKSYDIIHVKFSAKYNSNLDLDTYNKFYELAVAHHILTQEGQLKDAELIDQFVIKNAELWGLTKRAWSASGAWDSVKSVVSDGVKWVGKAIEENPLIIGLGAFISKGWKGIKFLASKLPFIGILFSLPFAIKNLIESYYNGKRILWEADLPKFGFSRALCVTPAGEIGGHVSNTFRTAVKKFKRNPEDLKELLTIFRTIGAFWIDVLFAVTNGLMAILDFIAVAGLFVPVVGWIASIGAMGGSFLLAIGIGALEMGAEYFKDEHWSAQEQFLLAEAQGEVKRILANGKPVKVNADDLFKVMDTVGPTSALPSVSQQEVSSDTIETEENPTSKYPTRPSKYPTRPALAS